MFKTYIIYNGIIVPQPSIDFVKYHYIIDNLSNELLTIIINIIFNLKNIRDTCFSLFLQMLPILCEHVSK